MSVAKKTKSREFDENKLASLTEPISVYLERHTGGRKQPIDLPVKPGEEYPGKGWSQDEVRQIPQWVVKEWSGGGLYTCKATGANGETMEWDFFFPPAAAPERQPPSMAAAAPAPMAQVVPLPLGGQPQGSWMSTAAQQYQQPQPASPQVPMSYFPPGSGYNPYFPPQNFYGGALSGQGFLGTRIGRDDEQRYQSEREARLALEAKIERERAEQAHREQIAQLAAEIRRTQEQFTRRPSDEESPAAKAAQAQVVALQKQLEQNQFSQQLQTMQTQFAQMFTELRQSTAQQISAIQSAMERAPKGPDPVMMMLTESMKAQAQATAEAARVQAQAQTEVARLQAEAAREAARNGFGPQHMMDLISRVNMGTEHLSSAYRGAVELMQQGVETLMNLQQPSMHPALEMVGQAAQGGLGILQQYVAGQSQAKQAQAAATAQVAMAQQQMAHRAQPAQLGAPGGAAPAVATPVAAAVAHGERDEAAYFGPAWTAVQQFRAAVASGNTAPDRAAQGIIQAINHFANQGVAGNVRAFDLWKKGELAELVDALLPGAPTSYREQTTQALFQLIQQLRAGGQPQQPKN
jgi:hypothetical protein